MPDSTISAPVAADPIDRLDLGATEVREAGAAPGFVGVGAGALLCMAEE